MIETKLPVAPPSSTALGRPIDPRYPSNIAVAITTFVTGLAFWALPQLWDLAPAASPLGAAGAVFLAWAIAREIDPDNNSSAYLAMVFALAASAFLEPSLLLGFGILIGTRLISGTVGLPLRNSDLVALIAIGALMGANWTAVAGAFSVAAGTLVADGFSRRAWSTAVLAVSAAAATLWARSADFVWTNPGGSGAVVGMGLLVALVISLPAPQPSVTTDLGNSPIEGRAIGISRILLLVTVAAALLLSGKVGFEAGVAVAGPALLGTAATAVSVWFRNDGSREVPDGGHGRRDQDNRGHPHRPQRMSAG